MQRHWPLPDAASTRAAGFALGKALAALPLERCLRIAMQGELGAGKTTLVGGLMSALGFQGPVRSPTYTLLEPYEFPDLFVYHMDLYRLTDPAQLDDLGLRDLMQPRTVLLAEWPDRGGDFFAHPDLQIDLMYAGEGRELRLSSSDESLSALIHGLSF